MNKSGSALRFLIPILAIFYFGGLSANAAPCRLTAGGELHLKGSTNRKMLDCLEKLSLPEPLQVTITSQGGSVKDALAIGDILAQRKFSLTVKKHCNSSCANYFIPLAEEIFLSRNAMILLHGSIDPGFARKFDTQQDEEDGTGPWEGVAAQAAYVQEHNIPKGWLLYRDAYTSDAQSRYISGDYEWHEEAGGKTGRMLIVTPGFFASCFPSTPISGWEQSALSKARKNPRKKKKLIRQGVRSFGTARCTVPKDL